MTHAKTAVRVAAGVIPLALTYALVPSAGGQPAAYSGPEDHSTRLADTSPGVGAAAGDPVRITLVTGDTILYTEGNGAMPSVAVELDPASGTHEIELLRAPDGLYAIPDQARPLIEADVLDQELFDVRYLAENGYTDAESDTLPVIVTYDDSAARSAATLADRTDALAATEPDPLALPSIDGAGTEIDKAAADRFWRDVQDDAGARIDKIWLDRRTYASLDESRKQIGVPKAWDAGVDGSGATVAVLDTGYDAGHPDLEGQVVEAQSFVPGEEVQDRHGHGTHVASTIVGTGAASDGRYAGVAPGADLIVGKVLSNGGSGQDSWIIAGMEWAAANADVVNMSLGSYPSNGQDPMSQAVDRITAETDTLFVISAGNYGPGARTVTTPATADSALAVAAVDVDDQIADFSSRGPRVGDGAFKPEIAAPGNPVVAAWAAGTDPYPGVPVGPHYVAHAGTSMASPHVVGVAAMLMQQHPDWGAQQLKDALMSTSVDAGLDLFQQGAGRVDAARATEQSVFATGKADLGTTTYPLPDDAAKTTTLTYTNTGDRPVTLRLKVDVANRRGTPAGKALTLSTDRVTVPAGGQADVELSLDPARSKAGQFTGYVRADGPRGARVHTAVAYVVEAQTHEVTVQLVDRFGDTPRRGSVVLHDLSDPNLYYDAHDADASGRAVFEVPAGDYAVEGIIYTGDPVTSGQYYATDVFSSEALDVDGDRTVRIDATKAVDFEYDVIGEHRPLEPVQITRSLYRTTANGEFTAVGILSDSWDDNSHHGAIPGRKPRIGEFSMATHTTLREPLIRVEYDRGDSLFTVTPEWTGRFDETRRLPVVDVGLGRPEDYDGIDVDGKLALVTSDEYYVQEQVETAAANGAAAVLVTRSAPGSIAVAVDNGNTIPVVGTTYAEGKRLRERLGRGPVTLRLTGVRESGYTYALRSEVNGAIPDDLTYRVQRSRLAVVENAFHSEAERLGGAAVGAYEAWEGGVFQFVTPLAQPTRRTDYVSAGPNLRQRMQMSSSRGFSSASVVGGETAYRPGQRVAVTWLKAPAHPMGYTELPCNFCRSDYILWFNPGNVGDADPTHRGSGRLYATYQVYRDGQLIENPDLLMVPEPATYRIDRVAESAPDDEHLLANRNETSWTFQSKAPRRLEIDGCRDLLPSADGCAALPLIMLGYDLPLDLDNRTPADRRFEFTVRTERAKGYRGPDRVRDARVWVSYDDGDSWQPAKVKRHGSDAFKVEVRHPRLAATNGYVSLRVEVWDDAGSRTEQTIERAYGLR